MESNGWVMFNGDMTNDPWIENQLMWARSFYQWLGQSARHEVQFCVVAPGGAPKETERVAAWSYKTAQWSCQHYKKVLSQFHRPESPEDEKGMVRQDHVIICLKICQITESYTCRLSIREILQQGRDAMVRLCHADTIQFAHGAILCYMFCTFASIQRTPSPRPRHMKKESQGLKRRAIGPWPAWCASVRCTKGTSWILFSRASYWMWMTCKCVLQTLLKWIQDLKTLRKEAVRGRVGNESGGIGWDLYRHSPVHRLPPRQKSFVNAIVLSAGNYEQDLWQGSWKPEGSQPNPSSSFLADQILSLRRTLDLDIQTLLLSLILKAQVDSKNEEIDRIKVQHGSASHELAGGAMLQVYESYFPQKIVLHGPKRV